ncbi:MAG TPA: hypothetical protein VGS22_13555 [Thermoanaerobaculia bacterium]|jgi:hypothetical protein|nr:hypothetical protein [Thermoanaerobaculia bacterium]
MKTRSARPKLSLSRETLKRLEESLDLALGGGTTVASNTSACTVGESCITCTRPRTLCEG